MNEMPYPPPPNIIEAARRGLGKLNVYADPGELERLRELLADYSGVPVRHILLSQGSELLLREMICLFSKGRNVVTVSPSFFPTVEAVKQFAAEQLSIRLSPPMFDLDLELLMDILEAPTLLIIDNPNNPTGKVLLDRRTVEAIAQKSNVFLVVDEAYFEFSEQTFADMVADYSRLAVIRTMDKAFGLAGVRVGYGVAGEAFLNVFSSFYSFLSQPSLSAAIEALEHSEYMKDNVRRTIAERERLRQSLSESGSCVYPSSTNFLLIKSDIPDVVKRLQEHDILVSDLSNQLPLGFARVSIGTREENDTFFVRYREAGRTYG
jgi:histidinol-phosphate aminotransferase